MAEHKCNVGVRIAASGITASVAGDMTIAW